MRFALVGCGEVAYANAAALMKSDRCELAAVMDVDAEAVRALGDTFEVRQTTSLESVLEDSGVDAVVAAVPHHLHADICVRAAEAGKHVIVEKPMATTLDDADRMIRECDKAGVALSVLFSFRYKPHIVRAREVIQAGALGEVIGTSVQFMIEMPGSYYVDGYHGRVQTDWRGSWEKSGGGILITNCCHMLDYFRYLTGLEVEHVSGIYSTGSSLVEVEDTISVSMRYENGAVGSLVASGATRGEVSFRYDERIWGTHGTLEITPKPRVYTMRRTADLRPARWQRLRYSRKSDRIVTYFDRFVDAVERGESPDVTGADGRSNLAIILAAYESAKSQKTVTLGPGVRETRVGADRSGAVRDDAR